MVERTSVCAPRSVSRETIYNDVVDMFGDNITDILVEYPLRIHYDGERAIDTGGVCRDMFSTFWTEAYLRHCDGERLFILANNPSTDSKNLPLLGTILSYGFLTCGVLPIKMACFSNHCLSYSQDTRQHYHRVIHRFSLCI